MVRASCTLSAVAADSAGRCAISGLRSLVSGYVARLSSYQFVYAFGPLPVPAPGATAHFSAEQARIPRLQTQTADVH